MLLTDLKVGKVRWHHAFTVDVAVMNGSFVYDPREAGAHLRGVRVPLTTEARTLETTLEKATASEIWPAT